MKDASDDIKYELTGSCCACMSNSFYPFVRGNPHSKAYGIRGAPLTRSFERWLIEGVVPTDGQVNGPLS
jgi:hypothetical protein